MIITIGKPCAITEKGGRSNNEDSIYPLPEQVTLDQKLFMVCDGVGGAEKGEVASSLACESIQTFFSTFLKDDPTPEFIHKAVHYAEVCFDSYVQEHPEAMGMATTLTMAYIASSGIVLAHIGDSRIYHPQRNVIIRAIQGTHTPTEADIITLNDIQPDDFLFLCTDGVLERLKNEKIAEIFNGRLSVPEIKDALMEACDGKTRDNFSFYIIPIQKVEDSMGFKQNILSFLYSFI